MEDEGEDEKEEEKNDEVRLWEDGFKDRYYESKFDVNKNNLEYRIRLGHEYVRGLCWVLQYYYQGIVRILILLLPWLALPFNDAYS